MLRFRAHPLLAVLLCASPACSEADALLNPAPVAAVYPHLLARPELRDGVLARIDREPYTTILAKIQQKAAREYEPDPDPLRWDHGANGQNAETAQANALLAWLFADEAAASKARAFFVHLETDWETNPVWDINIRMPATLMGYTNAYDLLMATPWFPPAEADEAARKLTEINGKFFEKYLENGVFRALLLGTSQNNHPIRTACAIGYVALAFPNHPDAPKWGNWAVSELDYLWGPKGHYVQPDGGVSEGPFYFGFAWGVSAAFFIAMRNAFDAPPTFQRDCRNRVDIDPWTDHGCVEGEEFSYADPLHPDSLFSKAAEWSLALRLPWGSRPPLDDAYFNPFNGNALLGSFGASGVYRWDWEGNRDRPYEMGHGADLSAHHLLYFDDTVPAEEPSFTTRFFPDMGHAVFRSDWSNDARWLLLVAENGPARKTLHQHVDGTSISLAAYGEYLLMDPGYYKPGDTDNAKTAHSPAHNVVLIDGKAAPDKGLLNDFGDADAFLRNAHDGDKVEYAEARQDYQDSHVERSIVFLDGRYFIVADRIRTTNTESRTHAWRMNGYAGRGSGGAFLLRGDGARWERPSAGIDVHVASTEPGLVIEQPPYVELTAPYVQEFELDRAVTDHAVIDAVVQAKQPGFLSVLLPYRVGAPAGSEDAPIDVEPLDLGTGVAAWIVHSLAGRDLALLRSPSAPQSIVVPGGPTIETDAEFVVTRLDGPSALHVLVRGTHLSVGGQSVATAPDATSVAIEE